MRYDVRDKSVVFRHLLMVTSALLWGPALYKLAHLNVNFDGLSLKAV
jgi:hypothetical protein